MKVHLGWALVSALMLTAGTAQAQFQKPEDAVKYRQSAFSVMGTHFSRLGAMANGRVPFDAKAAQDNAAIVLAMSKLPWAGFTPDTEKVKSRAKPELWMEMPKVQAGADKMVAAAGIAALAKEKGVKFNDIPDTPELSVPTELRALCDRFLAGNYDTSIQEDQLLKLKYIHMSANWNHPLGRRDGSGVRAVYINAPTADSIRVQHPHVPDWTLW